MTNKRDEMRWRQQMIELAIKNNSRLLDIWPVCLALGPFWRVWNSAICVLCKMVWMSFYYPGHPLTFFCQARVAPVNWAQVRAKTNDKERTSADVKPAGHSEVEIMLVTTMNSAFLFRPLAVAVRLLVFLNPYHFLMCLWLGKRSASARYHLHAFSCFCSEFCVSFFA